MGPSSRPRRSVLFVPGSNARALEKARSVAADCLILDLEDAVAPAAKADARQAVVATLTAGGYGPREMIVRINALATQWGNADLKAIAHLPIAAVLLPKVESPNDVRQAEAILTAAGASDQIAIWCMIETPLGVLRAESIAAAGGRIGALVVGTSDLATDLRTRDVPGRGPLLASLCLCILAARAHGLVVLDGVHLDLSDDAGFVQACHQGRDLGFDGKTLIHPKTIAAANEVFAASEADIVWAQRVIAAHHAAEAAGQGVVLLDGKLIENLHVVRAQEVVALAQAISTRNRAATAP